jgi:tyrosine-protein phosphatase YwqE
MKNIPYLQLTENPNQKNDFIIFRHNLTAKKRVYTGKKSVKNKKSIINNKSIRNKKSRNKKNKKGFFNIF